MDDAGEDVATGHVRAQNKLVERLRVGAPDHVERIDRVEERPEGRHENDECQGDCSADRGPILSIAPPEFADTAHA